MKEYRRNNFFKSSDFLIEYYLQDESLKPVLPIYCSLILYIISAHYIDFILIPYFLYLLASFFKLYNYFSKTLLCSLSQAFLYSALFFQFLFFYSSFHKTTVLYKCWNLKSYFFKKVAVNMIRNNTFFIIVIIFYFALMFILLSFLFIGYEKVKLPELALLQKDIFTFNIDCISIFRLPSIDINNLFIPFSIPSILISFFAFIFSLTVVLAYSNDIFIVILRPMRFHFWTRFLRHNYD